MYHFIYHFRLRHVFRHSSLLRSSTEHLRRGRRRWRRSPSPPSKAATRTNQSPARSLGLEAVKAGLGRRTVILGPRKTTSVGLGFDFRRSVFAAEASGGALQRFLLRRRVLRIAIVPLPRDLLLGNGNRSRFETFNRRRNVSIELFRENVIDNYWDWNEMKSDKEIDCHLVWGLQIIFDIPAHAQPHVIFPFSQYIAAAFLEPAAFLGSR
jgi:hypothetical protein